jgi:hypothetical protein
LIPNISAKTHRERRSMGFPPFCSIGPVQGRLLPLPVEGLGLGPIKR